MHPNRLLLIIAGSLLLAGASPAQEIIAWDSVAGMYDHYATMSPAYQWGLCLPWPPPWPSLGGAPPAPIPLGGTAIDNITGTLFASDGFLIEFSPYPYYPPAGPPPGVFAWNPPILPPPHPPVPMGPIHGMTFDPLGVPGGPPGLLWVTDGTFVAGVLPIPGTPVIVLPFQVVGPVPVAVPPLTGIDWDPFAATLWAVDIAGNTYNFVPAGPFAAPLGMGPPYPFPPPVPPATGLALDKTGPLVGMYVSYPGATIIEHFNAIAIPPLAAPVPNGLTFHAMPAPIYVGGSAVGIVPAPMLVTNSAAWGGNPGFALDITGFLPMSPMLLVIDLPGAALLPLGMPFGAGNLLIDVLFSPTAAILPLGTMPAAGLYTLPIPLVGPPPASIPTPPGVHVIAQVVAFEGGGPLWVSLSDGLQFAVGLL